jgi:hypothetical protein
MISNAFRGFATIIVSGFGSAMLAQPALPQSPPVIPYCDALKQIANMAMTRERFAPIVGKPRDGNFRDTELPLPSWNDCAFYGPNYYTCDSTPLPTAEQAEQTLLQTSHEILSCLGTTWDEVKDESSSTYMLLHPKLGPASIALNLDQTDSGHVVRFSLFLRRR